MPHTREPRRAAMRNALLLALFSTLLGPVPLAHAADPQATHPLVGRWKVASINGAPPPNFLSGQVLVIQADAQLINIDLKASGSAAASESAVQKALRDALMRGTWRADKARLYVSNSPRRETGSAYTITQQGKLLSLDPDPYFSDADVPSKATYERLR
ncbi:MAG: hypothetical protein ACK4OE_13500 [Acidovorax sp.]|uniref:hypothetical protein n=1 Tax=Acidovorax sp. TaxID=1872122 RepID=UPI00391C2B01